jgi:hypothetical protein
VGSRLGRKGGKAKGSGNGGRRGRLKSNGKRRMKTYDIKVLQS